MDVYASDHITWTLICFITGWNEHTSSVYTTRTLVSMPAFSRSLFSTGIIPDNLSIVIFGCTSLGLSQCGRWGFWFNCLTWLLSSYGRNLWERPVSGVGPLMGSGTPTVISKIAVAPQGSHSEQLLAAVGTNLRFNFINLCFDWDFINVEI